MKWLLCVVLLLTGCTADLEKSPRARARANGPKASPLKLLSPSGETVELVPGARFEVTVVSFFSPTWNPDNASHVGQLQKLFQRRGTQPLRVVLVAYDEEPEKLRKYLASNPSLKGGIEVAVADEPTLERWEVKAIPTTVVVAPDGAIIERLEGQPLADRLWDKIEPFFPE